MTSSALSVAADYVPDAKVSWPQATRAISSSETTRYLAAAAYNDAVFRRKVLREFVDQKYRAVSPEPALDAAMVTAHCQRARRWKMVRDALLVACTLPLFLSGAIFDLAMDLQLGLGLNLELYSTEIALTWLLAFGVLFTEAALVRFLVVRRSFAPTTWSYAPAHDDAARQNVVVYGGFVPFVGAGVDLEASTIIKKK